LLMTSVETPMIFAFILLIVLTVVCLKVVEIGHKEYRARMDQQDERQAQPHEATQSARQVVAPKTASAQATTRGVATEANDSLIASNGLAFDVRAVANPPKPVPKP